MGQIGTIVGDGAQPRHPDGVSGLDRGVPLVDTERAPVSGLVLAQGPDPGMDMVMVVVVLTAGVMEVVAEVVAAKSMAKCYEKII